MSYKKLRDFHRKEHYLGEQPSQRSVTRQTRPEVKLGRCVINYDVNDIMAKVLKADVVCRATLSVNDAREIVGSPKLQEAYELRKSI